MPDALTTRFIATRQTTLQLAAPLSEADMQIQAEDFASPSKWHLAHTTWFFEEFILRAIAKQTSFSEHYRFLFNSYYESVGQRQPQKRRGLISRPSLQEILDYRREVDQRIAAALESGLDATLLSLIELGIHHEQQHQELFVTDILFNLSQNPTYPAYLNQPATELTSAHSSSAKTMISFNGGLVNIGHADSSFCFDNEQPQHQVFLRPYQLAQQLVSNADWIAFIDDGGYENPLLWLSDGWKTAQTEGWQMPLYWQKQDQYLAYGLYGLQPLVLAAPVSNISFFEADAYARWAGKRLPTEAEWEFAASSDGLEQLFGKVWQWTASPYVAYPGFKASAGAVGEYNGKFMNGQYVLRGSSFATPEHHARLTYRNFFYPHQRWQFTGLRLAE